MLETNRHSLNFIACGRRRAAFSSWQYVFIRAYGEIFRRLPLEIYADQNIASLIRAPLDTIYFDCVTGAPFLIGQLNESFTRDLVEHGATRLYADEWAKLETVVGAMFDSRGR